MQNKFKFAGPIVRVHPAALTVRGMRCPVQLESVRRGVGLEMGLRWIGFVVNT